MKFKYYKVLSAESLSPSTRFDYGPYLPADGKPGKWLPKIPNAKLRQEGYYASRYWNFWYVEGGRIFEVELRGVLRGSSCGVEKQVCAEQMRLLKDVTEELLPMLKSGNLCGNSTSNNTGLLNTGSGNIGSSNAGDFNLGSRNTGSLNDGDFNTGDSNTGMDNVGDFNSGSSNSGSGNKGHRNSGDCNIGSYNSGSNNVGNFNSGSFNKGNGNVGKWNIGDYCSGFFNTQSHAAFMFNKPTKFTQNSVKLPRWLNFANCKNAFEAAPDSEIEDTLLLPNFDFQIFFKITGISKSDFERKLRRNL